MNKRSWFAELDGSSQRVVPALFHHPLVGDPTLAYEVFDLPADPGLSIVTCSAEPASVSEERLGELARWAWTRERLATSATDG